MNLLALQTEALAHGFDPVQYGARVVQYINDAQALIASRVDYYIDEATDSISTVAGTATYPFPTDFARMRSLYDSNRNVEIEYASLRMIDNSSQSTGAPAYYAITGANIELWPVPDGIYPLVMRYWKKPAALVNDTDTPVMPEEWHSLLWTYAVAQAFKGDDDIPTAQAWMQDFNTGLSMFAADVKFPSSDGPSQAASMWDREPSLGRANQWI